MSSVKDLKKKAQQISVELSKFIDEVQENNLQDEDWFIKFEMDLCQLLS